MGTGKRTKLSLQEIGPELIGPRRRDYWRSLDELARTDEFNQWVEDEFPHRSSLLGLDRRDFVKLMGASMLMAGLAGCRRLPQETIVPYAKQPEGQTPGIFPSYASTFVHGGYGIGVLIESREGRPGKVEGSPIHPASLGSSNPFMQASLYGMYDPDRSQSVMKGTVPDSWETTILEVRKVLESVPASRIRVLTGTVTSPTVARQMAAFLAKHPGAAWHQYEPDNDDRAAAGAQMAFGRALQPVYDFSRAQVILSLDCDFLAYGPGHVRYARDFAKNRQVEGPDSRMSRLYAAHAMTSSTAATADHRLPAKPTEIAALAHTVLELVRGASPTPGTAFGAWAAAVAQDLLAHQGASIVCAGDHLPAEAHAAVFAINQALGNLGSTVRMVERIPVGASSQSESIRTLVEEMNAGQVDALFILGCNPVYSAPRALGFAGALAKVKHKFHLGEFNDETGKACDWHMPESHFMESWGDARAFDGTVSLQQPLIRPLYDTRSLIEFVDILNGHARNGREVVLETYAARLAGNMKTWETWLHDGMVPGTAAPAAAVGAAAVPSVPIEGRGSELELVVLPDPNVHDGRYSNNAWLQELPKPITQVTWDNAVYVSKATAERLGVQNEEWVDVSAGGATVRGPIWINYGQADGTVVVHIGYGRTAGGTIAEGTSTTMPDLHVTMDGSQTVGFDAVPLLGAPYGAAVELAKAGGKGAIAAVQIHHAYADEGKDIVRSGTLKDLESNPNLKPAHGHEFEDSQTFYSLTDEWSEGQPYKWAMTIDLGLCIGCNACTIACQAENNIPVVGKEQVSRGREMHWIRIDRYLKGEPENPSETVFQPVPCMHCDNAPCEPVCPVAATTHSHEGLNQMVYNRCVGTRYCSNNCPYKVRRFNFLNYGDKVDKPSITLLNNPNVSVRGRGVMEKCTYCVQRINRARIAAKREDRTIEDGEVVTACQAACPTKAIVFGNSKDADSAVSRSRRNPRNYRLLGELNTRPQTTYLGRVRNPNPAVAALEGHGAAEEHEAH